MNAALRNNPVFWLMWFILGAAVLAGLGMVAVAMRGADRALPADYHWEGEKLGADFERAQRAASLGVRATLRIAAGECQLELPTGGSDQLRLLLAHSSDASLDRQVLLKRATAQEYRAPCEAPAAGRWRIMLADDAAGWMLRHHAVDGLALVELAARDPNPLAYPQVSPPETAP